MYSCTNNARCAYFYKNALHAVVDLARDRRSVAFHSGAAWIMHYSAVAGQSDGHDRVGYLRLLLDVAFPP